MDDSEQDQPSLKADTEQVRSELAELRADVKDLLEAWNTATGMVRFVKWLSTFATALAVLYATVKGLSGR